MFLLLLFLLLDRYTRPDEFNEPVPAFVIAFDDSFDCDLRLPACLVPMLEATSFID